MSRRPPISGTLSGRPERVAVPVPVRRRRAVRAGPGGASAALGVLLVLLACSTAQAQLPWFKVEVVVFAQGDTAAWQRNNWREEGPPPLGGNTVELLVGSAPGEAAGGSKRRNAFRRLPDSALDLGSVVDRLERSSDYRVVLHVGWRQPGFPVDDAPGVHLVSPRGIGTGSRHGTAAHEGVDGTVRLWRRRFLHVDADLAFGDIEGWRERTAGFVESGSGPASAAPERLRVVRLTRSLRLRQGRLHYVDHPLFGILLFAKRID